MDKYTQIIIDVVLARNSKKNIDKINFEKLLVIASHNRVLLVFSKNLIKIKDIKLTKNQKKILKDIINKGEENLQALRRTIKLIDRTLTKKAIPYLIVKTFKYLDYVTFDLDFLVHYKNFAKTIKVLKNSNILVKKHPNPSTQGLHQRNCFYPNCIKMDLHRKFFWLGVDHISEDFVWNNTQTRKIAGINTKVPSLEADFLLHNKQLVFERRYITFLDFLAIKYACEENLNWDQILKQVKKYKWEKTFFVLLAYLNAINKKIFNNDIDGMIKIMNKYHISRKNINKFSLPFEYSFSDVMSVFKEIKDKHKHTSVRDIAYYIYSQARYKINGRMPYYDHWYDFGKKHTRARVIHK